MRPVTRADYSGDYIHYGIREHGMVAAMNGIALHGGFFTYGGTFLAFADYCRPAIRLSALMGLPVTYVMTHDSIGLGEDGPTHQPVEHSGQPPRHSQPDRHPPLRRGRDGRGVGNCHACPTTPPTLMALSRQNLPTLRTTHSPENLTAKGAYVLREANGPRDVTLIATGSEVEIALNAADLLAAQGLHAAVVSVPVIRDVCRANPLPTAPAFWAPRHGSGSRPPFVRAGTPSLAAKVPLSA